MAMREPCRCAPLPLPVPGGDGVVDRGTRGQAGCRGKRHGGRQPPAARSGGVGRNAVPVVSWAAQAMAVCLLGAALRLRVHPRGPRSQSRVRVPGSGPDRVPLLRSYHTSPADGLVKSLGRVRNILTEKEKVRPVSENTMFFIFGNRSTDQHGPFLVLKNFTK